jgi:hypothetical protein
MGGVRYDAVSSWLGGREGWVKLCRMPFATDLASLITQGKVT